MPVGSSSSGLLGRSASACCSAAPPSSPAAAVVPFVLDDALGPLPLDDAHLVAQELATLARAHPVLYLTTAARRGAVGPLAASPSSTSNNRVAPFRTVGSTACAGGAPARPVISGASRPSGGLGPPPARRPVLPRFGCRYSAAPEAIQSLMSWIWSALSGVPPTACAGRRPGSSVP